MRTTRFRRSFTPALALFLVTLPSLSRGDTSDLWGRAGERWEPRGRLPDFSYAGYHAGRRPIPSPPVVLNVVRDCGARGDGSHDDTLAFRCALDRARNGAIFVPPGRYRITDRLFMNRSHVVLRGAGRDRTVLFFPRPLAESVGFNPRRGIPSLSQWSYEGGYITSDGGQSRAQTVVTLSARRGDSTLTVQAAARIGAGDIVVLRMQDEGDGRGLAQELYNHQGGGNLAAGWFYFPVRVRSVTGNRITLDRPLPCDVDTRWHPALDSYDAVTEIGIEDLGIEFPGTPYVGHHHELGFNAIGFDNPAVFDSWIRNVRIQNADNGILADRAAHMTIRNVRLHGGRARGHLGHDWQQAQGHIGIRAGVSVLVEDIDMDMDFVHELSVNPGTNGNVYSNIRGNHVLSLDHHGGAPIENLFNRVHPRVDWNSGGGESWPQSGARGTFWNFDAPITPPPWAQVQTNVVGRLDGRPQRTAEREYLEDVANLEPGDLYASQLRRRLAVEDHGTLWATGDAGSRLRWTERSPERWGIIRDDGDDRYWLASSTFGAGAGLRLGEYSLANTPALAEVSIVARARSFEALDRNDNADFALVLGYVTDERYCYALYSRANDESGIFRVVSGRAERVAHASGRLLRNEWLRVEFRRRAGTVEMLLDGRTVASAPGSHCESGRVGLGSLDDSACFDDVRITSPGLHSGMMALSDGTGRTLDLDHLEVVVDHLAHTPDAHDRAEVVTDLLPEPAGSSCAARPTGRGARDRAAAFALCVILICDSSRRARSRGRRNPEL